MLPYLLALLAVGGLVGRQMAPATLGEPYRALRSVPGEAPLSPRCRTALLFAP